MENALSQALDVIMAAHERQSTASLQQRARHMAHTASEVREDKVEAARRALQQGTLPLSGEALAAALLRHVHANDTGRRR